MCCSRHASLKDLSATLNPTHGRHSFHIGSANAISSCGGICDDAVSKCESHFRRRIEGFSRLQLSLGLLTRTCGDLQQSRIDRRGQRSLRIGSGLTKHDVASGIFLARRNRRVHGSDLQLSIPETLHDLHDSHSSRIIICRLSDVRQVVLSEVPYIRRPLLKQVKCEGIR